MYNSADMVTAFGDGVDASGNPAHNTIELTAVFEDKPAVEVDLTFDSRGGGYVAPARVIIPAKQESVEVDLSELNVSAPNREGHTFSGWSENADGRNAATRVMVGREGKTLYAKWTANSYTITFDTQGGSAVPSITRAYGKAITAPRAPTREYYSFGGWSPALPATMPAGDLTVKAVWQAREYTVTLDANGGEFDGGDAEQKIPAPYGTRIAEQLPQNYPARAGHVFQGWKQKVNGSAAGDIVPLPETMPGGGATYVACWLEKQNVPARPRVTAKTRSSITIDVAPGQRYAIVDGNAISPGENVEWQKPSGDSHTFENRTPGQTYSLFTYIPGDAAGDRVDSDVSPATVVTLPHVIEVRLDLGGYDYVAAVDKEPAHQEKMNLWKPVGEAAATAVHLTWEQARRFRKDEFETVTAARKGYSISDATRDGYTLDGWFMQNNTRMLETFGAISDYFDKDGSGAPVGAGTEEAPTSSP